MDDFKRAYYDAAYGITKAALAPVVDAITDSVSEAVQRGTREALLNLGPSGFLDLLRKKK
jgi:hypothetical protein